MTAGVNAEYEAIESGSARHLQDFKAFLSHTTETTTIPSLEIDSLACATPTAELKSELSQVPPSSWQGNYSRYLQAAYLICPYRRLFCNENGFVGLRHSQVANGDNIVALDSGPRPLILRDSRSGFFQVVGECYMLSLIHI